MTAGLGTTDGGSLTVDRYALVERWVEAFGLDLASPVEGALVVQEVAHVASLVDAAVAAERLRVVAALTRWLEISKGSWPHDGRIARAEVARWVRWIADCGPSGASVDAEPAQECPARPEVEGRPS